MNWKDTKYLLAYIAPATAFAAVYYQGFWSFSTVLFAFFLVPLLELVLPKSTINLSEEEEESKLSVKIFDWLLYSNIPILYGLLWYYFSTIAGGGLETYEVIGMTMSVGILVGTIGINVAHELGHRVKKYEQTMSKSLLLTAMYMHFFIEHNRGHHKNIATDNDPASARFGENLYSFWIRSTFCFSSNSNCLLSGYWIYLWLDHDYICHRSCDHWIFIIGNGQLHRTLWFAKKTTPFRQIRKCHHAPFLELQSRIRKNIVI